MPDIFDLGDLPPWLQVPAVDEQTGVRIRRYANGWLMSATGLTSWPDPIPDDLWAWAIELASIAYGNPGGVESNTIGSYQVSYGTGRREEILEAARRKYGGAGSPKYSFPEPDWYWTSTPDAVLTD